MPHRATDLDSFVLEVKEALDANMLHDRPINHIFSSKNAFHPTCAGDWLEFGVASGEPRAFPQPETVALQTLFCKGSIGRRYRWGTGNDGNARSRYDGEHCCAFPPYNLQPRLPFRSAFLRDWNKASLEKS